jgi:hypothetical protein
VQSSVFDSSTSQDTVGSLTIPTTTARVDGFARVAVRAKMVLSWDWFPFAANYQDRVYAGEFSAKNQNFSEFLCEDERHEREYERMEDLEEKKRNGQ